ncbi:MAG: ATP-binding protein [Eubacteriales bacterium]|nr:ATP-binding protein [Eubacteriales bacterium]
MAMPNGISIIPSTQEHYNCPECQDRGYIIIKKFPLIVTECDCVIRKANMKRLERSGLMELAERCSFDSFRASEPWQKKAKDIALAYLASPKGSWFFICGRSGSGKTHLCTAICKELIDKGREVYYMKWREEAPELKACVKDPAVYREKMKKLSEIPVLYIDDFLKGSVTEADMNLAYRLLNDRYNTRRRTIISSERPIEAIAKLDEAVAGRIFELSRDYCFMTADVNYRLK